MKPPIILYCIVGFENYRAQMIMMTRQYVALRTMSLGQRSRPRFASIDSNESIDSSETSSCPAHNYVLHSGI